MRDIANRRLVPIEESKEILNRLMGATNVLLICRIRGPLSEVLLRRSLDLLQQRHPRLRSIIADLNGALHFQDDLAEPIPLQAQQLDATTTCRSVELEELNRRIDSDRCLLRVRLLLPEVEGDPCHLLILAHHAMADGSALVELVEDLVGYCRQLEQSGSEEPPRVVSRSLTPSVEDLMPEAFRGPDGETVCASFVRDMRAKLATFEPRTLPIDEWVPTTSRSTGTARRRLGSDLVGPLREACRETGASLHGMLVASLLFAVVRRLRIQESEIPVCCRSSVSLRGKVEPPLDRKDVSLVASFLMSFHRIRPETTLWDVAGEVLEQLWTGYRNGDMFKGLSGNRENSQTSARGRIPITVFLTNLDEPSIETRHGPFVIEEMYGVSGSAAFSGVLGMSSMILNDQMMLGFFYSQPALSDATVEAIADDMQAWLDAAGSGRPVPYADGGPPVPGR